MTVPAAFLWVVATLVVAVLTAVAWTVGATRRIATDAERKVPAAGKFVTLGSDRVHYVEAGQGPPILFIHGLGGQLHHFRHTMFDRLARDFRVIALDRPGSGYSTRPRSATGALKEQAETVHRLVEALKLERPLLVGHSLGGAVALAVAIDHPQDITGIALLSPLTATPERVPTKFRAMDVRSRWLRAALAYTVAVPGSLKRAPQTLDFVFGPQAIPEDYAIEGGGYAGLRPAHIFGAITDFVAIGDSLPAYEMRYGEVTVPVGILFGTADNVLDFETNGVAMQRRVANLHLELLDGIGHMPQFVAPDGVEAFIREMARKSFG